MAVSNADFGLKIRSLRQKAGLTLQELGTRSDIAFSTISRVEKGQLSPTFESIVKLAKGLDVDLAELFATEPQPAASGRRSVAKMGSGVEQNTPHYIFHMLNTDLRNKHFTPIYATIKARSVHDFPALISHEGEEFLYVLSGTIELHSNLYEALPMKKGDGCYFDSRMGHAVISVSDEDAEVLWICSSATVAKEIRQQAIKS